jgi:hypothetical protein
MFNGIWSAGGSIDSFGPQRIILGAMRQLRPHKLRPQRQLLVVSSLTCQCRNLSSFASLRHICVPDGTQQRNPKAFFDRLELHDDVAAESDLRAVGADSEAGRSGDAEDTAAAAEGRRAVQ